MCKDELPQYYKYWGKARKRLTHFDKLSAAPNPLSTRGEGDGESNGTGYDYHLLVIFYPA